MPTASAPKGPRWLPPLRRLGAVLLPACCALCGGPCARHLCPPCHAQFFSKAVARCRVCANPVADGAERCGACLARPPAFDATIAAADYALPLDQLVLQLKFGARLAWAALFAREIEAAVRARPGYALPALLCPVPLGPARLAERGFNQALEIARPLARGLGLALEARLASRVHDTAAQSLARPAERGANIARAFAVADAAKVAGRHIGIVDDVMTSGQTLNELAATFKRYGAARVSNLVFARTPPR